MATKIKFRGTPVCRAQGNSKIYESLHKHRLDELKRNHESFAGMAIGFLAPKAEPKQEQNTIRILDKVIKVSKTEYDKFQEIKKREMQ